MRTKLNKINQGFTIVETLIVLAIAALIITIVLIAVPDLQRASRNTNILHDAQNIASGIQEYEGNNSGEIPTQTTYGQQSSSVFTGGVLEIGTNSGAEATAHAQPSDVIFWENAAAGPITFDSLGTGATASSVGVGGVFIDNAMDCGSWTAGTGFSLNADQRAVAILYPIEGSSSGTSSIGCITE